MGIKTSSLKRIAPNFVLLGLSVSASLFLAEVFVRYLKPFCVFEEVGITVGISNTRRFTADPEFGFRPILGNRVYSRYGTRANDYSLEKKPNSKRILFIGDSVTKRGEIIEALRKIYGEDGFEYWNAGVESFNTRQEVNFYKRFNVGIDPDQVILTFHLNDFTITPTVFLGQDNKLVLYNPQKQVSFASRWLFQNSYLYRLILGAFLQRVGDSEKLDEANVAEVRQSLTELRDSVAASKTSLTVLVHPWLQPYDFWKPTDKRAREQVLEILEELKIQHIDLLEPLTQALEEGVDVTEKPRDLRHPSADLSAFYARYIFEKNGLIDR